MKVVASNSPKIISVSLVIPVRDEAATVGMLLDSIRSQTRPPKEVLFVDAGSVDGTIDELRAASFDFPIRIIEAGEATPGRARNTGIAAARNEWIALTDAGIRLEPTWLERLVEVAEREPTLSIVYGNFEPIASSFFEVCAALAYVPPKQQRPGGRMRGPSIASAIISREVWKTVGGFPDLRAAEDLIFMERIQEHSFKVGWAPTATVWWELSPSLGAAFRKFVLYSRHNVWAGRQTYWHYGVARKYIAGLPFVALALAHSFWWLCVPIVGALARVARSIWDRREGQDLFWIFNPAQFIGVSVILVAMDMATFIGWAQARYRKPAQSHPSAVNSRTERTR